MRRRRTHEHAGAEAHRLADRLARLQPGVEEHLQEPALEEVGEALRGASRKSSALRVGGVSMTMQS
jgi:hypothetical protein